MSEYWVSRKRYFCRYCQTWLADDAPSRRQHESGLRHIGNKERYVRGLYKQSERRKKDEDDERREIAAIEKVSVSTDLCEQVVDVLEIVCSGSWRGVRG